MKFQNVTIATIFIRLINHLEIVIDIKYQYYQTIFRYKKAFLRFGCLCSNATVGLRELEEVDDKKFSGAIKHHHGVLSVCLSLHYAFYLTVERPSFWNIQWSVLASASDMGPTRANTGPPYRRIWKGMTDQWMGWWMDGPSFLALKN